MEDPFAAYAGQDVSGAVASLKVISAKAKQTGNPYTCLELEFINGFKTRLFPNSGDKFAISQAIADSNA